ncbi:hypothetical protein [Algoriphagus sp.]|uniref:hypothetical protein n=1 Tax=Algoriphagus sp. TaxID=1872435 RepID=UPI003297DE9A
MKRSLHLFFGLFLTFLSLQAQEKKYFGQAEIGFLYGHGVEQWDGNHEDRFDVTFMIFNGVRLTRSHRIGFVTGLDQYEKTSLIPLALGWRGFLGKEDKPKLFAGLDMGGGSAILEKKESNEWSKSWFEGGFLFSPSMGISFPARKGSTALSLSVAYKSQQFSQFFGVRSPFDTQTIASDKLPPGYSSLTETSYHYHSFVVRAGLMF